MGAHGSRFFLKTLEDRFVRKTKNPSGPQCANSCSTEAKLSLKKLSKINYGSTTQQHYNLIKSSVLNRQPTKKSILLFGIGQYFLVIGILNGIFEGHAEEGAEASCHPFHW